MAPGKPNAATDISTRTIRKTQARLIPLLFLLYIVAFLDRINIGFAALTMNADLAITSAQYGLLAGIFFLGYFLFEIPSNLILHKVGARTWIARILVSWGIVAVLTGFVRNAPQLYAARFLLGIAEAGFFPGILLYLTYWFPQRELARVIALFMSAIPVSSVIGAPVSGFILDHVHWAGVANWRWLLILEGLPAIVSGIVTYFALPNRPEKATFLTPQQRDWIVSELAEEKLGKFGERDLSAWRTLAHQRVWRLACIAFAYQVGAYAIYFWMPQAVGSLSNVFSNSLIGILVMIPHLAGLVAMVLVSRSSDRSMERRYHASVSLLVGGIALISLGASRSAWLSIAIWAFAAMGNYAFNGPFWSLPSDFLAGISAASGLALVNSIGSLGAFLGPFLVGAAANGPAGIYRGLAVAGVSFLFSAALVLFLPRKQIAGSRVDVG